jgi:hypothetical protein
MSLTLYEGRGAYVDIQWSNLPKELAKPPLDPHPQYGSVSTRPLSTYVDITQADGEGFKISVYTEARETLIYELNGFVLDEFNEYVDATVHVKADPYRGILGLGDHDDRENATLFLEDGVYSMNNRGKATTYTNGRLPGTNSFGTYPFFMGRVNDGGTTSDDKSSWFGVLHKNLAAQDWWIKRAWGTGDIAVQTYALAQPADYQKAGGMFIIIGNSPENVTATMHTKMLTGRHHFTPYWTLGWHQGA